MQRCKDLDLFFLKRLEVFFKKLKLIYLENNSIYIIKIMSNNLSITITFGDQAENHVGMQQIGELAHLLKCYILL